MRDQVVGDWLTELASEAPAPGGGAAAAMNAAVGAALVGMVCNLTIGKPRYAAHEVTMTTTLAEAEGLRATAAALVGEDADAFAEVSKAYRMPRDTEEDKRARRQAIQRSLVIAAEVPLRTAACAARIVDAAGRISDGANVNVLSDVAVAAASAKAALVSAAVNVEVNLAMMKDAEQRERIAAALAEHLAAESRADAIVAEVRERINS